MEKMMWALLNWNICVKGCENEVEDQKHNIEKNLNCTSMSTPEDLFNLYESRLGHNLPDGETLSQLVSDYGFERTMFGLVLFRWLWNELLEFFNIKTTFCLSPTPCIWLNFSKQSLSCYQKLRWMFVPPGNEEELYFWFCHLVSSHRGDRSVSDAEILRVVKDWISLMS